ncbi:hypothetical protein [Leucobacter luti]|uniref:hypothetical protein n=1 Tax=Leucobacter luti TaxID=340320 RepID=UPI003CFBC4B5
MDQQLRGPFHWFRQEHFSKGIPAGTRLVDTITVDSPSYGRLAERLILVRYPRRLIAEGNRALTQPEPRGAPGSRPGSPESGAVAPRDSMRSRAGG